MEVIDSLSIACVFCKNELSLIFYSLGLATRIFLIHSVQLIIDLLKDVK